MAFTPALWARHIALFSAGGGAIRRSLSPVRVMIQSSLVSYHSREVRVGRSSRHNNPCPDIGPSAAPYWSAGSSRLSFHSRRRISSTIAGFTCCSIDSAVTRSASYCAVACSRHGAMSSSCRLRREGGLPPYLQVRLVLNCSQWSSVFREECASFRIVWRISSCLIH